MSAQTFVPALKIAPRAPLGPSLVLNADIPFVGMALDLQKSAATRRETYILCQHKNVLGRRERNRSPVR